MSYPDFSNGSEDPEGSTVLTGSSSVDSKSNVKTPAKCEGSPIESLEAAFYKSTANKHGPSDSIKKSNLLQQGATIEATFHWYVNLLFGINLEEGAWFENNDFKLMHAFALIRPTKNKYHISITRNHFSQRFSLSQTVTFFAVRVTWIFSVVYLILSFVLV
ncbi:hypothetical protein IGI04_004167 [Brassica rapa subsp. trilocularis]|uniref:BRX domain-containing protein n=1 Tax=Brassica rapa subsp. trilocularis TaxID=1813537 RepID=A0ABQ7P0H3_BRACM|nr:hypothetical protein IGI04_021140 [Brassica rapa subsp. trilocularis]KAG5416600.1 hypothetical protein IGI04_004167 [Brassica rapa subsp. trilocularis]